MRKEEVKGKVNAKQGRIKAKRPRQEFKKLCVVRGDKSFSERGGNKYRFRTKIKTLAFFTAGIPSGPQCSGLPDSVLGDAELQSSGQVLAGRREFQVRFVRLLSWLDAEVCQCNLFRCSVADPNSFFADTEEGPA